MRCASVIAPSAQRSLYLTGFCGSSFMAIREKSGAHHIEVTLSFTLMRSTIAELPDFVKLASRLGIKMVHARHLEAC